MNITKICSFAAKCGSVVEGVDWSFTFENDEGMASVDAFAFNTIYSIKRLALCQITIV